MKTKHILPLAALALAAMLSACQKPDAVPPEPALDSITYVVLEGGGPDQGPGNDNHDANRAAVIEAYGVPEPSAPRQLAYGIQQIRILTRSADFVAANEVIPALDAAERTGLPVWLHIDPIYGWGADGEKSPAEAPPVKFWEHPEMREWREFPIGDQLPAYIPRQWFTWGPWCSPSSAFPAIGAPKFVELARIQLREAVLDPLAKRLEKWRKEGRSHLFAGINIGWETHMMHFRQPWFIDQDPAKINTRHYPHPDKVGEEAPVDLPIDPGLIGSHLGYASLHWRGWTEEKLRAAAQEEGISRDEKFRQLIYEVIHDYMAALAGECNRARIAPERVYTHTVALSTVQPADTFAPPIWTAVNPYSTPGFTMDNKGGAKYDLGKLLEEIRKAPGSRGTSFGLVETYFKLDGNNYIGGKDAFLADMKSLFDAGATVQVFYGSFPFQINTPPDSIKAVRAWLAGDGADK